MPRRDMLSPLTSPNGAENAMRGTMRTLRDALRAPVRVPPGQVKAPAKKAAPGPSSSATVLAYIFNADDNTEGGLVSGSGNDWTRLVDAGDDALTEAFNGVYGPKKIGSYWWARFVVAGDTYWRRSTDCITWTASTPATGGLLFGVAAKLYFSEQTGSAHLHSSTDEGDNWTNEGEILWGDLGVDDWSPVHSYPVNFDCSPLDPNLLVTHVSANGSAPPAGTGHRIVVSEDGGGTWSSFWGALTGFDEVEVFTVAYAGELTRFTSTGRVIIAAFFRLGSDEFWQIAYSDTPAGDSSYTYASLGNNGPGEFAGAGAFALRRTAPYAFVGLTDSTKAWLSDDGASWSAIPSALLDATNTVVLSAHFDALERLWVVGGEGGGFGDIIAAVYDRGRWYDRVRNLNTLIGANIQPGGYLIVTDAP